MIKELSKDNTYLYVNYNSVKKYSDRIKLVIDNNIIFEGNIENDLLFELRMFKVGKFCRLYVEVDGVYLFLDKEIISYNVIRLTKDKINKFTNEFIQDIGVILNEY